MRCEFDAGWKRSAGLRANSERIGVVWSHKRKDLRLLLLEREDVDWSHAERDAILRILWMEGWRIREGEEDRGRWT